MPRPAAKNFWDSLLKYYDSLNVIEKNNIKIDSTKEESFITLFKNLYANIMNNYMNGQSTESLDHHKQTALFIYCLLAEDVIYSDKFPKDNLGLSPKDTKEKGYSTVFVEPERVALLFGLSYMLDQINVVLENINVEKIEKFNLPIPISCDNPYFVVLMRQLFYDFNYGNIVNPEVYILSLANTLYLIEYINLITIRGEEVIGKIKTYIQNKEI